MKEHCLHSRVFLIQREVLQAVPSVDKTDSNSGMESELDTPKGQTLRHLVIHQQRRFRSPTVKLTVAAEPNPRQSLSLTGCQGALLIPLSINAAIHNHPTPSSFFQRSLGTKRRCTVYSLQPRRRLAGLYSLHRRMQAFCRTSNVFSLCPKGVHCFLTGRRLHLF